MTVILNNKVNIRHNYKEPADGKFDDCTSETLKNLAAEDSSGSESNAVKNQTKNCNFKHEAEIRRLNNSNKITV